MSTDPHRRICPECGRDIALTRGGARLSPHNRDLYRTRDENGYRTAPRPCPGSRMDVADVDRRNSTPDTAAPTAENGA